VVWLSRTASHCSSGRGKPSQRGALASHSRAGSSLLCAPRMLQLKNSTRRPATTSEDRRPLTTQQPSANRKRSPKRNSLIINYKFAIKSPPSSTKNKCKCRCSLSGPPPSSSESAYLHFHGRHPSVASVFEKSIVRLVVVVVGPPARASVRD
jgi:hypothetical protein